jgi:hypothetical protein
MDWYPCGSLTIDWAVIVVRLTVAVVCVITVCVITVYVYVYYSVYVLYVVQCIVVKTLQISCS